jgi:hypothetical protein
MVNSLSSHPDPLQEIEGELRSFFLRKRVARLAG